ncbi:hypothetical protein [Radiobacillus sp. PE A8.2]|uniref:hypothetical protein n=1 Tax=Radiobacillus sp. PE A8.2 TaxID=3380349 RepID=UPI00388EF00D
METREVYLLFTDTGTLLTKAINVYTKSTLNHASLAFDLHLREVYSFGRKTPRNPFVAGFVKEDIGTVLFNRAKCAIYKLTISDTEYKQMLTSIQQIEKSEHNYRYNFVGLFCIAINRELQRKNAFFCSQFVATILSECGVYPTEKPPCLTKPQDLQEWNRLQLVYQGRLKDYPLYVKTKMNDHMVS